MEQTQTRSKKQMKRIVIDGNSLQARQHLYALRNGWPKGRLSSFVETVEKCGCMVTFDESLDTGEGLKNADILIILTWFMHLKIDPVLPVIEEFVRDGGSLFLLSNHSRVPSCPGAGHHTEEDGKLARLFGIELIEACFRTKTPHTSYTEICDAGPDGHPVLLDENGRRVVHSVVINNGCAIDRSSEGTPVLLMPDTTIDLGPNNVSPDGHSFCQAVETDGGRVLVTADSGFTGEPGLRSAGPGLRQTGPGLFERGDNALFIQQSIRWLHSHRYSHEEMDFKPC